MERNVPFEVSSFAFLLLHHIMIQNIYPLNSIDRGHVKYHFHLIFNTVLVVFNHVCAIFEKRTSSLKLAY